MPAAEVVRITLSLTGIFQLHLCVRIAKSFVNTHHLYIYANMVNTHSFHIPVMGISFTIDTPLKVSHLGIDSVISLGDDILLEKLRKMFCERFNIHYEEITSHFADFRAKRITAYLNLINQLTTQKFEAFKKEALSKKEKLAEYFELLPDRSALKQEFQNFIAKAPKPEDLSNWINTYLTKGSIDVNIMTKVDPEIYIKNEKQASEFNLAHSALRGYANSELSSSIVFSAGMNPKLYSYASQFKDFHPNEQAEIKKKIILKVSDYRSALIQGQFLAKKGIWVSEFRIESGLNCGGHAFATDGFLIGPILAEFKEKKEELVQTIHNLYNSALAAQNRKQFKTALPVRITAQGGVGTAEEHQFMLDYYQLDSVGWGSPFLLVPEATTVDEITLQKLVLAKEEDLYLSNVSPLGVQFNNLKNSTKEIEKNNRIANNKPGSPCVKKYLAFNKEFSEKGLCTASRKYQVLKIKELDEQGLAPELYQKRYEQIVAKECICTGLGTTSLLVNNLDTKLEGEAVSICPGPNLAYFSKIISLKEMTDHIYGRINVISRKDRPSMFVKELQLYVDYLKTKLDEFKDSPSDKQIQYLNTFVSNIKSGIRYYKNLFYSLENTYAFINVKQLRDQYRKINMLNTEIEYLWIQLPKQG